MPEAQRDDAVDVLSELAESAALLSAALEQYLVPTGPEDMRTAYPATVGRS